MKSVANDAVARRVTAMRCTANDARPINTRGNRILRKTIAARVDEETTNARTISARALRC